MSNYYYGPALDAELDYRLGALRHDAEVHRLARQAHRASRSGSRRRLTERPGTAHPAVVVQRATASSGRPSGAALGAGQAGTEQSQQPAGSVPSPVSRAA